MIGKERKEDANGEINGKAMDGGTNTDTPKLMESLGKWMESEMGRDGDTKLGEEDTNGTWDGEETEK